MIPALVELVDGPGWSVLPPGIHSATLEEIELFFATTEHRKWLFTGLKTLLVDLAAAGCRTAYLDGSYVTGKPRPGDYDLCWDARGVRFDRLPPCLREIGHPPRRQIKATYLGDVFTLFHPQGGSYLDSFQIEPETEKPKGILRLDLFAPDEFK